MNNPKYIAFSGVDDTASLIPGQTNSGVKPADMDGTIRMVRDGDAKNVPVYKLAGHFRNVEKQGEAIPFAVGQVVNDEVGNRVRIVATDRIGDSGNSWGPVVALVKINGVEHVRSYTRSGSNPYHSNLVQLRGPAPSAVEFVPVAE